VQQYSKAEFEAERAEVELLHMVFEGFKASPSGDNKFGARSTLHLRYSHASFQYQMVSVHR
jgi:hypothetical protein